MQTRTFAILGGSLVIGVLMGATAFVLSNRTTETAAAMCNAGSAAGEIGGPFTLVSETGETVTDADVVTKPSLIYFGYTFCPDVCPLDTVRNAEAVDILAERGVDVQPVFISIDPERDTAEVVDEFTANIHPAMLGLTGSEEQVRAASQAYRTYYRAHKDDDPDYYLVDHSTFTYLVTPDDGFAGFFRRELSGDQLADQVQCVLENT